MLFLSLCPTVKVYRFLLLASKKPVFNAKTVTIILYLYRSRHEKMFEHCLGTEMTTLFEPHDYTGRDPILTFPGELLTGASQPVCFHPVLPWRPTWSLDVASLPLCPPENTVAAITDL